MYFAVIIGPEGILLGFLYVALPLTCIWFPDLMGSVTGSGFGSINGPRITKESPGCIVSFAGWCLLVVVVGTKVYLINAG